MLLKGTKYVHDHSGSSRHNDKHKYLLVKKTVNCHTWIVVFAASYFTIVDQDCHRNMKAKAPVKMKLTTTSIIEIENYSSPTASPDDSHWLNKEAKRDFAVYIGIKNINVYIM